MKRILDSSDSDTDSSNSCSVNQSPPKPRKRYNKAIHPDFQQSDVSHRTFQRMCSNLKQKHASTLLNEQATSNECVQQSPPCANLLNQFDMHNELHYEDHNTLTNNNFDGNTEGSFANHNENDGSDTDEDITDDTDDDIAGIINDYESEETSSNNSEENLPHNNYYDQIMFAEANLTVFDVIQMVTAFSLRYSHSDESKFELMKLLKLCAGPRMNNLKITKYKICTRFSTQSENICFNYYCTSCNDSIVFSSQAKNEVKKKSIMCNKCNAQNIISPKSGNYFLSMNIEYQLRLLLTNKQLLESVQINCQHARESCNVDTNNIKDVYDSVLYKKILTLHPNDNLLTLNISTDGAPLTKSGKRGFWPIQLILNELSPKLRNRFVILGGLIIVDKEPKPALLNLYLSNLVKELNHLYDNGFELKINRETIAFKVYVLGCVVDAPCRALIQNRIQYNGYEGCSWCYQYGKYVPSVKGIRYPFEQDNTNRTNESHREDAEKSIQNNRITRGVKGDSSFRYLRNFDMIWSFTYEYMHAILLGVTQQIWNDWKNDISEIKINNKNIKRIEALFLRITPTNNVHRLPRSGIIQGIAKPKANELKSWLLYYSLPCLTEFLNYDTLKHYTLLVKCVHTLLKCDISQETLNESEILLMKFICLYEQNYKEERMTFNLHSLFHVVESIRNVGPLYATSAFPFESSIYTLKKFVNGPNAMDAQMAKKHLQVLHFKTGNTEFNMSENATQFCNNLFTPKRLTTYYENSNNVTYFGKKRRKIVDGDICWVYSKCVYKGNVYHSIKYSRALKTDDTIVLLSTGEYGRIYDIIKVDNVCKLRLAIFEICDYDPFPGVSYIKKIEKENETVSVVTMIEEVKEKILLVKTVTARYLCTQPNVIEVQ